MMPSSDGLARYRTTGALRLAPTRLAAQYGLVPYDPQDDTVYLPPN